ncbi:class I SAM-dependent methyltransferase [Dehalococcoidia bacterium]|nr:class I SAM-dependent methyltransferase [Dehalococcoidia bacterium]
MMAEWFEDEAFWESFYPFLFTQERFQIAEEQVEKILELVDFKGHDVLDLCCGPGRHSIALAKKGLTVTGVDRSRFLLAKAEARAEEQNVEVEWVEEDMRYFTCHEAFDLVLNMFTSFGYFDNKDDDLKVLQNIHQSLRPGGICLLDVVGKEWLAKAFQPTTAQEAPDGSLLVQRHEIFDDWTRIRNEWILVKKDKAESFRFHHTIYSAQELKDRLRQVGFQRIRMFGDLEGNEYGPNARRLVAVGWK